MRLPERRHVAVDGARAWASPSCGFAQLSVFCLSSAAGTNRKWTKRAGKFHERIWAAANSAAAIIRSADTKLRGRFCLKQCDPSHRRAGNASAALKISFVTPKRLFQHYLPRADSRGCKMIRL